MEISSKLGITRDLGSGTGEGSEEEKGKTVYVGV